ncbi:MAG: flagellar basal body L-ring protein FlgH [Desulfobulbaceae bacterium]|nr:flagellar basal body L-ring protein FlgH [Desulfobulbaceae bacterium]
MRTGIYRILLTLFPALILGNCVSVSTDIGKGSTGMTIPERNHLPTVVTEKAKSQEGAIFNIQSSKNLYQDSRACTIGDIVLVKIVETSSGSKKAETKTDRSSKLSANISSLPGVYNFLSNKNDFLSTSSPSVDFKTEFEGTGETSRNSTVTATVSSRVVDVTLDGNLIIRGFREVSVNNEAQHIILSGIVRPSDISEDNSILSSYIADARIEYSGVGLISAKQHPGWITGILDVVWPF